MAWKCKMCGAKNNFRREVVSGEEWEEYNKNGELVDYDDLSLKFGKLFCGKCKNTGEEIGDIAVWEE